MESLRWILLAAGIVFVLVIYIIGRSRRRRNHSMVDELDDDLPAFSAASLDDVDEGVGAVRIISGSDPDEDEIEIWLNADELPSDPDFTDFGDGSAELTWDADFFDHGRYEIHFTLSDGEFEIEVTVPVNVINTNGLPEWTILPEIGRASCRERV